MQQTMTLTTDDGKIVTTHWDDPQITPSFTSRTLFNGLERGRIQAHTARSGNVYFYIRESFTKVKQDNLILVSKDCVYH
jgi:hypothetical protein